MRKILIIGAALTVAAPASAQPADSAPARGYDGYVVDDRDGLYGDEASTEPVLDPREMGDMAQRMDRLVGAVMDLPIGGIVAAVDPERGSDYRRGETVRDMATRDDPEAEARIRGGIHASTAGIGALSQALGQMMPVLRQSMEQMERSMEQAMRPYRRD